MEGKLTPVTTLEELLRKPLGEPTESYLPNSMDFSVYGNYSDAENKEISQKKSECEVAADTRSLALQILRHKI